MTDPYKEITIAGFENVKKAVSEINLETISVEEIMEILKPVLSGLHIIASVPPAGLSLYRGVAWDYKPEEINQIIYPPVKLAKINRASVEREQLFYSSTSKNITLFEVNAEPEMRYVISEWRSMTPLVFSLIGYSNENMQNMGTNRHVDFGPFTYTEERFAKKSGQSMVILNYLSGLFCQPINADNQNMYKLTIAIAKHFYTVEYRNALKKDDRRFNGLTYPSIKGKGDHDNYAINKDVIDDCLLEFYAAEYIEVLSLNDGKYKYKIIDYADSIDNSGIINWRNNQLTWTVQDDKEIFFHEDSLHAFDSEGEEISPD